MAVATEPLAKVAGDGADIGSLAAGAFEQRGLHRPLGVVGIDAREGVDDDLAFGHGHVLARARQLVGALAVDAGSPNIAGEPG